MNEENKRFGLGIIIFIFNKNLSKILLLKRNKEKRERNKADWGNVGGGVEWGEKLIEACIREAKEEIKVNLDPNKIVLLEIKEITKNNLAPLVHFLQFIYATHIEDNEKITINKESDEFGWFELDKLPDKTLDSKENLIKIRNIFKAILEKNKGIGVSKRKRGKKKRTNIEKRPVF